MSQKGLSDIYSQVFDLSANTGGYIHDNGTMVDEMDIFNRFDEWE